MQTRDLVTNLPSFQSLTCTPDRAVPPRGTGATATASGFQCRRRTMATYAHRYRTCGQNRAELWPQLSSESEAILAGFLGLGAFRGIRLNLHASCRHLAEPHLPRRLPRGGSEHLWG